MTITQIIAVIAMLVSAIVALIVAYLHRKQMRQIELYKQDPSVGLIAPASRLTVFVKSKWDTILALGGPIYMLVLEFSKSTPVTRLTIFVISISLVLIFSNIILSLIYKIQLRASERFANILEFQDRQLAITDKIISRVFPQ